MLDYVNNDLLADALVGLGAPRKRLSPKWFYDQRGSELFEQITLQPEYYPTRTEAAILRDHATHLSGIVPPGGALVELGSGASVKTRTLLDAGWHFGAYVPIDISKAFLLATAANLRIRYPALPVLPVIGDFTQQMTLPAAIKGSPLVGFFPGSTIGNLEPADAIALLQRVRAWDGVEAFILGTDLIKAEADLVAAYDDGSGVTAAFNLNLLTRLNREAGADFDLLDWEHEARWTGDRIEMHLVSKRAQSVRIGPEIIWFDAGQSIHTESCRKYTADTLGQLASRAGWTVDEMLMDDASRYAVTVLRPV